MAGSSLRSNIIPSSRLSKDGQALPELLLALPNYNNRAVSLGNYNYEIQETILTPKRSQLFKIDYVPTDKDRFYVRGKTYLSENEGYAVSSGATPVGFFGQCYCFTESGLAIVGTHIFSPTIVMEYNTGVRHNHEGWHPFGEQGRTADRGTQRVKPFRHRLPAPANGIRPQNPNGWIPTYSFGGVTNGPSVGYDSRFLTGGTDFSFNLDDALSITHGNHLIKVGISFLRNREYEGETSTFAGAFSFAKDTSNPLDTNYAYSNAASRRLRQLPGIDQSLRH